MKRDEGERRERVALHGVVCTVLGEESPLRLVFDPHEQASQG